MKYLMNWIEKELNPEKHISSKTTSSEYYYFYGAKVRLADHLTGNENNDLEIICVRDLMGKNKQFLVKEGISPNMVIIPDVKTLKIVLTTFIFQFKNKFQNKQIKLNVEQESIKLSFNNCIDKLNNGGLLTTNEISNINKYLQIVCPQWMSLNEKVRTIFLHLFKNKVSVENVIDIINLEFPNRNTNKWQNKLPEENINTILQYLPDGYDIKNNQVREHDPVIAESTEHEKFINKYNDYRTIGFNNLSDEDKDVFINTFGTLIVHDTDGLYSKLTTAQRKKLRILVQNNISYDEILKFFNNTFTKKKKSMVPTTTLLTPIIDKFLKMYNIGIIKYPNESDFDTTYYTNFVNEHKEIIDDNKVQEETSTKNDKVLTDNMTSSIEGNIENNSIVDFNHDTDKTIKESYKYASAEFMNIPDIHEMFDNNQINILDEVIKKINDTDNVTSFETRRITDVFAKHYSDIWDKLTWSQKELCSSIITEERMNLNETDFIINKIFDKDTFNWPVTEQCRKDIKMYCQQIKESRMVA